ncbi:hypothetical protein K2173_010444 [Erythroxylum novogranatense]|uniref:Uncharacterized protein n=1 Tax=Erythroxylum novogranatense TaxID=1862640 RepID=A0AAV8TDN4_9ROSI|nr:hypothetical protein K2173_010444 [Erythroxylum novogranatense]
MQNKFVLLYYYFFLPSPSLPFNAVTPSRSRTSKLSLSLRVSLSRTSVTSPHLTVPSLSLSLPRNQWPAAASLPHHQSSAASTAPAPSPRTTGHLITYYG